MWRVNRGGLVSRGAVSVRKLWAALPTSLPPLRAVVERHEDHAIIFISGQFLGIVLMLHVTSYIKYSLTIKIIGLRLLVKLSEHVNCYLRCLAIVAIVTTCTRLTLRLKKNCVIVYMSNFSVMGFLLNNYGRSFRL